MRQLILVKHSVPHIVPTLPAHAWHLAAVGQQRCRPLAQRLAAYGPATMVSSPEPKAVETATRVAAYLQTSWRVVEGLHEHDRSHVGLLPAEQFTSAVAASLAHPAELRFGQETAEQADRRFRAAMGEVLTAIPTGNIMAIAHGTVIALFVAHYTGLPAFPLWQRLGLPSFVVLTLPDLRLVEVVERIVPDDA